MKIWSDIQNYRLKYICKNSQEIILVNSKSLKNTWGEILGFSPQLINTSSISNKYIYTTIPYNILPSQILYISSIISRLWKSPEVMLERSSRAYANYESVILPSLDIFRTIFM